MVKQSCLPLWMVYVIGKNKIRIIDYNLCKYFTYRGLRGNVCCLLGQGVGVACNIN